MERLERFKGHSAYTINRRLVSKIFVIVNVTTLFINVNNRQPTTAEASSIKGPQLRVSASAELQQSKTQAQIGEATNSTTPSQNTKLVVDTILRSNKDLSLNSDLKLANNLETNALIYLQKYGYMNAHSNVEANNLISEDSFSGAISSFQRFAGIPETGIVDNQTLRYMQMPRCGNTDRSTSELGSEAKLGLSIKVKTLPGSVRRKRYALQGSKWRRQELTYRISQYPTRFNGKRHEVDAQIEKAFGIWSQVAPINFVVKRDGRVHIDIRFASGDHGDGDAFDGPGNTLAHAYFPQYGGDAHFDDQEYWTVDSYSGTNIFQVAAHELGHSLGLGHSNVREALMAPFYQKYKPNFKLHIDDVLAIQALYGDKPFLSEVPQTTTTSVQPINAPTTVTTTTTTITTLAPPLQTVTTANSQSPTTRFSINGVRNKPGIFGFKHPDAREMNDGENSIPDIFASGGNGIGVNAAEDGSTTASGTNYPADLCSDSNVDAITRTEDGSSYVFKGDFYWLLTNDGLAKSYPRKISADWDGLPSSLDAALTWADGKTFFFKGNKYWRYKNRRRDVGYPKLISAGFAGIPDDIDAAFVWSGNGRTYIFKGTEYWRFDSKADPPVSSEYPRSIKVWNGVPFHINAAFKWENNVTYFFKGSQYYRFNDKEFKVESRGKPPFPRLSAEWWFGCVPSNLAQKALSSSLKDNPTADQNIDWSFFAGLEANTKIMGTHISDHNPGSFAFTDAANTTINNDSKNSETITSPNTNQLYNGFKMGPHFHSVITTVSSSAISIAQNNFVVLFGGILMISINLSKIVTKERYKGYTLT